MIDRILYRLYPDECFPVTEELRSTLENYLNYGKLPSGFLRAVLENNLCEAFGKSMGVDSRNLRNIVNYVWQHAPRDAHGSVGSVEYWLAKPFPEEPSIQGGASGVGSPCSLSVVGA